MVLDYLPGPGWHGEHIITIRSADVVALVAALGGGPDDDPVELIEAQAETFSHWGRSLDTKDWLREKGVRCHEWYWRDSD
ncbi:MAG: hypothetical protein QM621_06125 [Aeromicrobium sp.]|uniref:hypothetical protein n=1 Tax=Aeromicrobium sp. TaxID=1871063 RepID=UPI0039E2BE19